LLLDKSTGFACTGVAANPAAADRTDATE